nr:putative reverse transcriptase domain-containing protein [Tanacetum cinerariifolium]
KFWWKKDPLVILRGLAWSKISNFEKWDYGALFAEWSNHILCMAPTSTELLQPWLIRSMDYFLTLLVDGQPNGLITASPEGIQPIICAAVVHDPKFEQQPKELIENVGDGDPSIVLKELAAVKQMMNAIEIFIKSRNDNLSEDSMAKQSVEKEIESSDGKLITNQIVQHPLESPKGKRTESSILHVFHGELSVGKTSKNEALSKEFDPKEYDKNVNDSGVGKIKSGDKPTRVVPPIEAALEEVGEGKLIGPELVQETTEKISLIKDRLNAARDVVCFGKKGKLAPRFVGPFEITKRIGPVTYRLRLLEELNGVYDTFHVSNLKKCLADPTLQIPLDEIWVDANLKFVEEHVEILEREFKKLKQSRISIFKVR